MKKAMFTTPAVFVCILVLFCGFSPPLWADGDPNDPGQMVSCNAIPMSIETVPESCWEEVFSRNGSDGGQLTVDINGCEIVEFIHYPMPQSGGYGVIADLEPDDVFIVWDEDAGHGDDDDNGSLYFEFTGDYIEVDPNDIYIRLSTTDSRTEWTVFLVTSPGTLTKTGDCCNEHDAIHVERYLSSFIKEDDIPDANCVIPGDDITYTICWDNENGFLIENAYIIDWLPSGVDFVSANPEGDYDPNTHSYIWPLDDIDPNDTGCVELYVTVNTDAISGYFLHNVAELIVNETVVERDTEDTDVCCWAPEPDLIYVDQSAIDGANTGMNWEDAYLELTDALEQAANSLCASNFTIYVAQGTYLPGEDADDSFVLPDNVKVYGGFPSGGCPFALRSPKKYETILTGDINDDGFPDIKTIVTMGDESLLDGFIVTQSGPPPFTYAIYGNNVDFEVAHCAIEDNYGYGIYAVNGNVLVKKCTINENDADGIYHAGEGHELTVENSWMLRNGEHGISCDGSTPSVLNSIVSESSLIEDARAGISMVNPADQPILQNCTISNNMAEGIQYVNTTDPNYLRKSDYLDVRSCIVYYNNSSAGQVKGLNPDKVAHYSCIQDCNELPTLTNYNDLPGFAYTVDPNGRPDPTNYHLAADSFCIDKGDPVFNDLTLPDYDGEIRIMGTLVDVGADEVNPDCGDVANELDWNADGIINFEEFNYYQRAWLSHDPNDPEVLDPNSPVNDPNSIEYIHPDRLTDWYEWKYRCNLDATGTSQYEIDLADLNIFFIDWLWQACWRATADCPDSYNALDYDHDGLVNMVEYSLFAKYWQTYLPADSDWQFCNLDDTGDSQYIIDLSDLMLFANEWLWISCTRVDEFVQTQQQAAAADPNEPEPTALEQALQLNENICFLSDLWQNDPNMQEGMDPNEWQDFMDTLCLELDTLIGSLDASELMAYNLVAGPSCCGQQQMMMSGGGGGETMSAMSEAEAMSMELTTAKSGTVLSKAGTESEVKKLPLDTQIELAQKYVALDEMAAFLEKLWLEEPTIQQEIDAESWQDFMDAVYGELLQMQLLFE